MSIIDEIKKNAVQSGAKIQTSEAAQLEKIFNRMFYLDKDIEEETKFVKQVMTRGLESQERTGLHASALIVSDKEFCVRQQVLSLMYKQLQGEQLQVSLMRIFEEGNAIHEKWQRLLIRAGYGKAKTMDRTRFNEQYMVSYTPDIVCRIPEFYDGVMVGEIKSVNTFQFKKMINHPTAHKQLQLYLYLTGYSKGFVLCDDKNTQDFKLYVYNYEPETVAPFIDRMEEVKFRYERAVNEGKLPKRCVQCTDCNCKRAEKCPMRDACWNIGMGRIEL